MWQQVNILGYGYMIGLKIYAVIDKNTTPITICVLNTEGVSRNIPQKRWKKVVET
jgi:hypothetical protein